MTMLEFCIAHHWAWWWVYFASIVGNAVLLVIVFAIIWDTVDVLWNRHQIRLERKRRQG